MAGIEPTTNRVTVYRSTYWATCDLNKLGSTYWLRTSDPQIIGLVLYQLS